MADAMTVGALIRFVAPALTSPEWPPDVFAIVSHILKKSGAYTKAVDLWPPSSPGASLSQRRRQAKRWAKSMRRIGRAWRDSAFGRTSTPKPVREWWRRVLRARGISLEGISERRALCEALLQLLAAADEASAGVGIVGGLKRKGRQHADLYHGWLTAKLLMTGTLARDVNVKVGRVLPKVHTPQTGMTLRSLSHHLAWCETADVDVEWRVVKTWSPNPKPLNLLIVPWPKRLVPRQFSPVVGKLENMDEKYGFFGYSPEHHDDEQVDDLLDLYEQAVSLSGRIDGVVFPELALTEQQYQEFRHRIVNERGAFLIAGVGVPPARIDGRRGAHEFGQNYVRQDYAATQQTWVGMEPQHKHHRWQLDRSQVLQYGLGTNLSSQKRWWEYVAIGERKLTFTVLSPWLTICNLICEDLARQDPVGEIVRSVGPNLVVALLMDGPQLNSRWSARYATVLAEDPGSSVLALTSVGMCGLSRRPGEESGSRHVALWKDARSGAVEIVLPKNAGALVLTLCCEQIEEWTADGRGDGGISTYPVLMGVHPVFAGQTRTDRQVGPSKERKRMPVDGR